MAEWPKHHTVRSVERSPREELVLGPPENVLVVPVRVAEPLRDALRAINDSYGVLLRDEGLYKQAVDAVDQYEREVD